MKTVSTYIRSIYSPGFSSIMMWFFNTNLTLGFTPWISRDNVGFDQYDKNKFVSTSIDYEKAAALYLLATPIIEGKQNGQVKYLLQCNKQATLLFEYKLNSDAQMRAYLTIEKQGEQIPFEFRVQQCRVKEADGNVTVMTIQTGLGVFVKTLEAYLKAVGADRHLSKLTEEELGDPQASGEM